MNRIYKIAKKYGKGTRARTCAAAFLAAFALTGVMGMGEAQAAPDANVYTVNTLNANNNLTVGGIAGNGFYQFFVDSNGAFHAAANKFSVDEDGKVTATEGETAESRSKKVISQGSVRLIPVRLIPMS